MKRKILGSLFMMLSSLKMLFARAGGGGGGHFSGGGHFGGGGRYYGGYSGYGGGGKGSPPPLEPIDYAVGSLVVGSIALVTYLFYRYGYWLVLKNKLSQAAKSLKRSAAKDNIWHEVYLQKHVEETYRCLQQAWTKRDMNLVSDLLTDSLYSWYSRKMEIFERQGKINFMDRIKIDSIKVVGMEDRKEDSKDKFTAYVRGTMVDEMLKEGQEPKGTNAQPFEDLYYFARYENRWLLYKVENELDFWNVVDLNVLVE